MAKLGYPGVPGAPGQEPTPPPAPTGQVLGETSQHALVRQDGETMIIDKKTGKRLGE